MYLDKLTDLKEAIQPYLFFWNEWVGNGNCNLNDTDIFLIEKYLQNDFTVLKMRGSVTEEIREIKQAILRLEMGFQIFKDFVIVNFLQKIIDQSAKYPSKDFLQTPIKLLEIDSDLKECLVKFKCYTLHLVFTIYKAEDFNRKWIYQIIVEYQTLSKREQNYSSKIPLPMK